MMDENVQVEFIKDNIKMLWINGNINIRPSKADMDRKAALWQLNYQSGMQASGAVDTLSLNPFMGK